jgi:hypothetical protein
MEENTNSQRKHEVLVSWQEEADKQANRLMVLMLLVIALYNYYALLVPIITSNRIDQVKLAKEDLVHITSEFEVLRDIYDRMTKPPPSIATRDMRMFQDQIIPALQTEIANEASQASRDDDQELLVSKARRILVALESDMKTLTELYNIHSIQHPRDVADLPHLQNDPIYELDLLLRLDEVIKNLQGLASTNEDVALCELARTIFSNRSDQDIVRLGNSLTDSFKPYKDYFGTYTTITPKLKFSPSLGLASYKVIKDLIAPPFEVRRIEDLSGLRSAASLAYEKNQNELEKDIEIPVIKASFDRTILISIVPTVVLILLHLINSYFSRGYRLLSKATKNELATFSKQDFIYHGPHFHLALRGPVLWESTSWILRMAIRIRSILASTIKVAVIIAPTSVSCVYFAYMWNRPNSISHKSIVMGFGSVVCVFIIAESVLLCKQWSNLFTKKE